VRKSLAVGFQSGYTGEVFNVLALQHSPAIVRHLPAAASLRDQPIALTRVLTNDPTTCISP
jgi:hypothetical protein